MVLRHKYFFDFSLSLQYLTAISPSTGKQPTQTQPSTSHPDTQLVPNERPSSRVLMRGDEPFTLLTIQTAPGSLPLIVEPFIHCKQKHDQIQQKSNNLDNICGNIFWNNTWCGDRFFFSRRTCLKIERNISCEIIIKEEWRLVLKFQKSLCCKKGWILLTSPTAALASSTEQQ